MRFLRSVSITAVVLVGSGLIAPAYAGPITVLDQNYEIHASTAPFPGVPTVVNESSSTPVSATISEFDAFMSMFADGTVGPLTGFLSTGVSSFGGSVGGAQASAILDFEIVAAALIELDTSGRYLVGAGISGIRFTDLTDQLVLLNYGPVYDNGFWDLNNSFVFSLYFN